jgi:hypothetical protein
MRRLVVNLCILAAFFGTPLRQAEAAGDWARSILADDLHETDGGVGDDAWVGTLDAPHVIVASGAPAGALRDFAPPPAAMLLSPLGAESLRERVWWPQDPPSLRHAWLQVFRF